MVKFELIITESYRKKEKIFLKQHRDVAEVYTKTLALLSVNPFYPSLKIHKLQGKLKEYHSVSINLQYRIIINFVIEKNRIVPLNVGSHSIYP